MVGKVVVTAIKIFAACLVFALCFVIGGALSGLSKATQQGNSFNNYTASSFATTGNVVPAGSPGKSDSFAAAR